MYIYYGCHVMVGSVLMVSSILMDVVERIEPKMASLFIFIELPLISITAPHSSSNVSNSC